MTETLQATLLLGGDQTAEQIIELALELVRENRYQPSEAFHLMMNDQDTGGEGFCSNCIDKAVKKAVAEHKKERAEIIRTHKDILDKGFYMHKRKKVNVLPFTVKRSLVHKLRDYPDNPDYSYERYDPNFSGYLTSPESCDMCGRYFDTTFTP